VIILDTNVLSEPTRPDPSVAVRQWLASYALQDLFTTAITQAEMLAGVAAMPEGRRRDILALQIDGIFSEDFANRVLPFDDAAAREFPSVAKYARGRAIMEPDAQIAAIARARGATLATRNVKQFKDCGITLINPWTGEKQ
jgi:hypothetical protein